MFSNRFNFDQSQNNISKLLDNKKKSGVTIYDLTESNPTQAGFIYDENSIMNSLSGKEILTYNPHPKGIRQARNSIFDYYKEQNVNIHSDSIFITSGTSESYSHLIKLLTNPGDEILIHKPGYPLLEFITEIENVKLSFYDLIYNYISGWQIDFDSLKNAISKNTKAIVIINPNNPTGSFIKQEEIIKLNIIAKENELALISDEVFFDFKDSENIYSSFADNNHSLTFTLNGLSKICALPQMKMSWIIVNGQAKIKNEAIYKLEIINDTFLSAGTPIQLASATLLKNRINIQNQIMKRIINNYSILEKIIHNNSIVKLLKREAGWYAVLKINDNIEDEERAYMLLDKFNVYIHPGYFFNFEDDGYIVLSLITKEKIFRKGIELLFSEFPIII